jgi:hypothetical protein
MSKYTGTQLHQIDGLEALHHLLCEVRLLADLVLPITPQTLTMESEHLATSLVSFANRLEAAIGMTSEIVQGRSGEQATDSRS